MDKKVAIIGGGPAGYVTAIRLNQYNIDTVVFEKERLGGTCLNWGCIPTKALVKVAELLHQVKESDKLGVEISDINFNFSKAMKHKSDVVERLVSGVEHIFKKRKIDVINEEVKKIVKNGDKFLVNTQQQLLEFTHIILATGSKPKEVGNLKIDSKYILSSKDLLQLNEKPESLAVIGGGVIGCEFASIFHEMGSQVQIIEFLPNLLPFEDKEVSKRIQMAFKKKKIKLHLKTAAESVEIKEGSVILNLSNGKKVEAEKVLLSVGRAPFINIEMEGFNIADERGRIEVDCNFETNEKNIFAIGDLNEKQMLAHTASKQGLMVAEYLKSNEAQKELVYDNIPRCTFTSPEVASVGLTEDDAKLNNEVEIAKFQFAANGKAIGMNETFGFVKTISDAKTGKILGMHIIGPNATELIAQGALLIGTNSTKEIIEEVVYAHPSLSEAVAETLESLLGLPVHSI